MEREEEAKRLKLQKISEKAEQRKLASEFEQMKNQRILREIEERELEEAQALLQEAEKRSKKKGKKPVLEGEKISKKVLMELALSEQLREKQEMEKKLQKLTKTMDYLERAKREEASPLVEGAYQHRLGQEEALHKLEQQREIDLSRQRHAGDLEEKKRMGRMQENQTMPLRKKIEKQEISGDLLTKNLKLHHTPILRDINLCHSLNGERAVVLIYVARIIFSTPQSLLLEAFLLSCLSLFALFVEISAQGDGNHIGQSFKTRPGASSGILLGSITVPGLQLSKLILILRAVPSYSVAIEELEYLKLQYWVASFSCLTVLLFLWIISRRHQESVNRIQYIFGWNTIYCFICLSCLLGFGLVLFTGKLYGAEWYIWILLHGLAAIKLIEKILHTFPACASIGESLLVTSGLVIYIGDMFAYTASKISHLTSFTTFFGRYGFERSEISTIIQGMISGLLILPMVYKHILQISKYFTAYTGDYETRRSFVFYVSLALMLFILVPSWIQFVHGFPMHPFLWVLSFVLSEPLKRVTLCVYWVVIMCVSVRHFYNISKNSKTERILLRKYYHLMAVSMFVPALVFQPKFLDLAFGAALAVFLLLEIIRIWKIWPLGHLVHEFMNAFTDHRDSDLLIVSHFSLLLGCALPIWLSSDFTDRPLAPFAGILSLGIGDTMASMVGHKYGVLRWSKTGKKTVEGTAAGITSVLAACFMLLPLLAAATGYMFTTHWWSLVVAVTVSGLLEAYTAQLDNAFIPLIFYSLLCL